MPRIMYHCSKCGLNKKRFFNKLTDIADEMECPRCKHEMERVLGSPSSKSTMIVDNGAQARETEIIHDIIELNKERDEKGYNRGE